jgi:hypothetical protein
MAGVIFDNASQSFVDILQYYDLLFLLALVKDKVLK